MYKTVEIKVKDSLEWWHLISEKRCDDYSHLKEEKPKFCSHYFG